MDIQEIGCRGIDLIDLAHGKWRAIVNALRDLRVP